jgi:iron complex outermembrane receptor protein
MFFRKTPIAGAIGILLIINAAQAQQSNDNATGAAPPTTMERVQITGSRINLKQAQLSGVGPITVIDAEAIQRSGAISVETLLQRLPASSGAAGNQTSAYWTGNGYGTTQVNLRGLGIDRTLVLLNGRRIVNGGTGANSSVDLNMIPVALMVRRQYMGQTQSPAWSISSQRKISSVLRLLSATGKRLAAMEKKNPSMLLGASAAQTAH